MELWIFTFMYLSVLMGLQTVTSSSLVIKKIDSHIAKQRTTNTLLGRSTSTIIAENNQSVWVSSISRHPTNYAVVKLYSRTLYFLKITSSGKIRGTKNPHSKFARLIMQSVATSIVRFKGQFTQKYLAMDRHGVLYAKKTLNDECLFKEKLKLSGFHTFASHKYSGSNTNNLDNEFYVAIKKNGKTKHGINTAKHQRAVQFVVLPVSRRRAG